MGKLDTDFGPLVKMFAVRRIYVVPDYQRSYAWKPQKQVAELWGDVVRLYRGKTETLPRADSHFIGAVVIGSAATKALGLSEAPVIDGQQRLLTLSILLIAIRDELVHDPERKHDITDQYLAETRHGEIIQPLIRAGEKDRNVYESLIKEQSVADKKSPVYQAYKWLCDALSQETSTIKDETGVLESIALPDYKEETIDEPATEVEAAETVPWAWETLIDVIGGSLELVSISDVPEENAYSIFATLNSTGTPLDQIDLIRNAIFMLLPKTHGKVHRDKWRPLENSLGRDLLQNYFHTWVMTRGRNVPAKDTYKNVSQELRKAGTSEAKVTAAMDELYRDAWSYLLITRPESKDREKFNVDGTAKATPRITAALLRLCDWGTVPMEPVLLVLVKSWRDDDIEFSSDDLVKSLGLLESFVVRRFINQVPPNDLRSIFARITQQLLKRDGQGLVPALAEALIEPNRRWPSDPEIFAAFAANPLYRSPGQKQTFFILKRIAESLQGKECPHITRGTGSTDFSIEHVLPQTFTDEWKEDLKRWGEPDPSEVWEGLRHTAGNLTLTAYNSELGNSTFEVKKAWIEEHLQLKLSRTILKDSEWTSKEIRSRSKFLAEESVSIWKREIS